MTATRSFTGLAAVTAAFLVWLAFGGSLDNGFLYWDDRTYLHDNPNLHSINLTTLWWMMTDNVGPSAHYNWQPLTAFSHALDIWAWGFDARMHRMGNLFLHWVSALGVFMITLRVLQAARQHATPVADQPQFRWVALAAMALFAIHPLRVESVVWIAERKDVLCGAFYLLAVASWMQFKTAGTIRWRVLSVIFAVAASMAKPMAVSLPVVLVLLDHWPYSTYRLTLSNLNNILRSVVSKIDYVLIAFGTCVMAIVAQSRGEAITSFSHVDLTTRILNAAHSLLFYLYNGLVPSKLAPLYTYPSWIEDGSALAWSELAAVLIVTIWLLRRAAQKNSALFVAWGIFVICLTPVLGIVQVGMQAAADRYTYLAMVGLTILLATVVCRAIGQPVRTRGARAAMIVGVVAFVGVFALVSRAQAEIWHSDRTLWTAMLMINPDVHPVAHINMGNVEYQDGMVSDALANYQRALDMSPGHALALNNIARLHLNAGRFVEAAEFASRALKTNSSFVEARMALANALIQQRRFAEGQQQLEHILSQHPAHEEARKRLMAIKQ